MPSWAERCEEKERFPFLILEPTKYIILKRAIVDGYISIDQLQ
jgi:hypothetical protein